MSTDGREQVVVEKKVSNSMASLYMRTKGLNLLHSRLLFFVCCIYHDFVHVSGDNRYV